MQTLHRGLVPNGMKQLDVKGGSIGSELVRKRAWKVNDSGEGAQSDTAAQEN